MCIQRCNSFSEFSSAYMFYTLKWRVQEQVNYELWSLSDSLVVLHLHLGLVHRTVRWGARLAGLCHLELFTRQKFGKDHNSRTKSLELKFALEEKI